MPSQAETLIELPKSKCPALVANMRSRVAVVVTHPWGLLGGNKENNVVLAAVLYFQKHNITTLRFDFGGSQIGRGYKEVEKVKEAASYLLNELDPGDSPSYILLVGYSYGSLIASSASADILPCIGCISISPPWSVQHWLLLFHSNYHFNQSRKKSNLPKLFVIGNKDNFTPERVFERRIKTIPQRTGAVLKDADHFFGRREKDLMSIIGQWLLQTYPQAEGSLAKLGQVEFQVQWNGQSADDMQQQKSAYENCAAAVCATPK
jgi:alpha/beta superfamily hydrolase